MRGGRCRRVATGAVGVLRRAALARPAMLPRRGALARPAMLPRRGALRGFLDSFASGLSFAMKTAGVLRAKEMRAEKRK